MTAGMEGLRVAIEDVIMSLAGHPHGVIAEADALLAPDGPLFPALRALGELAWAFGETDGFGNKRAWPEATKRKRALAWLEIEEVTGPLADACLAAAEVVS